ncbi:MULTISPECIES: hypothetical protein [unclassified Xanthobacter]|uniref:hypothetical protein n=1 Tax=unclassified Xanthobacter TaxID=2623496 RepID=UPI001EDF35B3|nr:MULTISPECIES: hypothetical protein [unclassified Xanthobacter]
MKIFHTRDISFNDAVLRIRYPDRVVEREVGPGLPALGPGWQAVSAVCLGGVLHCVRLSAGTRSAYWYLDERLKLTFNKTDDLLSRFRIPETRASLLAATFDDIETEAPLHAAMSDVVDLLREFSGAVMQVPGAAARVSVNPKDAPMVARAHAAMLQLNRQDPDTPEELGGEIVSDAAFRRGFVEAEHPAGGTLRIDYFLPYANFWYIGFSADLAVSYCTLVTLHTKVTEGIFDTRENKLYAKQDFRNNSGSTRLSDSDIACIRLIRQYLYPALRNRRAEAPLAGLMFRENHIGHYIWNELSCVDTVVRSGRTPAIFTYPSSEEPIYPVDDIFPEARGNVHRGACGLADVAAAACQGVAFFPFQAYRITQSLADRVLRLAFDHERAFAAQLEAEKADATVLLIGLRLENRCWRRQGEGYAELIRRLSAIPNRRFLVLFDGHNFQAGANKGFVRSFNERLIQGDHLPSIVREEIELVNSVIQQAQADGVTNVAVRNLVPCTMGTSIVATKLCDYFVTHWGAGLAKYKWIANAPGAVISSASVLNTKADLRIYDIERFREHPLALDYFPAELVHALGNENNLIRSAAEERGDFDIDPGLFAEFVISKLPSR